jgi:hypothetical protein
VIPPFNTEGVLPFGRYETDVGEVEQRLVMTFPRSLTRKELYGGWRRRREELASILEFESEWVDGSFVTAKRDAGDIDVVVLAEAAKIDALSREDKERVAELATGLRSRLVFGCHSFLLAEVPEGHPNHDRYIRMRGYWDDFWSRRRDSAGGKGYLEVRGKP